MAELPRLSDAQRDLLWTVAQHKYGWTHVSRYRGGFQVADALVRRGLVAWGVDGRDLRRGVIVATEAGRAEIERLFPVSPFALGTYEHQPGGWTSSVGVTTESPRLRSTPGA